MSTQQFASTTHPASSDELGSPLAPMVRKLQLWKHLSSEEQEAILALPYALKSLHPGEYVVTEGQKTSHSCILRSGFAYRQKVAADGSRSINAVHMKGDIVDLQNSLLGVADHSVQALTSAKVAFIPRDAILELAFRMPNIGMAMWYDTLVDASVFREWILNISRRDARARIAHLLCEFGVRLESLALGTRCSYELPMTQDQIADATGLTPVHVNRTLMALEADGIITRATRHVSVSEWTALSTAADFDDTYLHLAPNDQ